MLDLRFSMFGGARIVNNHIGTGTLGVQGFLSRLPGCEIPFRPPPLQGSGPPQLLRNIDKSEAIT